MNTDTHQLSSTLTDWFRQIELTKFRHNWSHFCWDYAQYAVALTSNKNAVSNTANNICFWCTNFACVVTAVHTSDACSKIVTTRGSYTYQKRLKIKMHNLKGNTILAGHVQPLSHSYEILCGWGIPRSAALSNDNKRSKKFFFKCLQVRQQDPYPENAGCS